MLNAEASLMSMLETRSPTASSLKAALMDACHDLGLDEGGLVSAICVAYALLKMGAQPEEVSARLSWQEFEQLSAAILRVSGYDTKENVMLTKPRAQLDIVATGTSLILGVDCKHYRRGHSRSALSNFARNQLKRGTLLRKRISDPRPIVSVILSISEPEGKFVEGVAVVPVRTLRSFLTTIDSYLGQLELK